ncbi:MAG: MBL fold metallo-hydrolase [Bacteroidetes bacterium]|nr:MBL fold metallo-hydrolase [Bacteroidota bacterium]
MNIGPYTLDILESGHFGLDGGAMFGVVPKTLWERAYAPADALNRIPMMARCLLLRSAERTILVDTGNTPLMPEKLQKIYGMDFSRVTLQASMARLGVTPEDVTDVVLTHLHFDHTGGSVQRVDETYMPAFTNARYYVQAEHWNWALHPTEKDRASFMTEFFLPLQEHGVLQLLDGPGEVLPHVHVELHNGHTKAMQSVRISDGSQTVFFPADVMPTGGHIAVPYVMGYDNFPLTSIQEKKLLLPRIVDEEWLVVFEHDALRQAARIVMGQKGPQLSDEQTITPFGAPEIAL